MNSENPNPTKTTAIETVRAQLRDQILNFDLPPGTRLHVDNLRLKFDVSTATMREALSRLLIDNLVTTERQRGFWVRELSLEDFRSISEARKIIEIGALRSSLDNRDDNWEGDIFAAYRKLKLIEDRLLSKQDLTLTSEWHLRNREFHDCLVQNCRNPWLIDFRRLLHQHSDRYHRLVLKDNRKHRDVSQEHADIFESAIDGNVERCVVLVENHIDTTVDLISNRLLQWSDQQPQ
ncbi:GntR family transcriptional regulator [Aliiroseovarius sediminis]|uniref:GntR family transcriptional regulator n=1 Tax=Aliiroseovarius sediminis TaxID=2925839 RepID=UPI001F588E51|nr:GntR family transcriptional regulator [Aliiroseovarius sediminis]MCI2395962.1 GntR family transcriptional regulator [Aliiroseovarius sediminis]